jgi:CRISPR type II-A-associated protein Csn2
MRLVHIENDIEIELCENLVTVLCLEKTKLFSDYVSQLWSQYNGAEGNFILSEKDKELDISKNIIMIINPYDISCNNKKIITRIHQEISEIARCEYIEQVSYINQMMVQLLEDLSYKVPYHVEYNLETKIEDLLKIYDLKMEENADSLLEKIIDYIRITHQVLKVDVFVFVNLKMYLDSDELESLYKHCSYEKIKLLLIEGYYKSRLDAEKCWIIDKDLCIIEIDELTAHCQCDDSVIT